MKKTKFIKPEMEFNPALNKYEPVFPLKKGKSKLKVNLSWVITLILVAIICAGIIIFFAVRNY